MKYQDDSMATMAPDVYAGPSCDGIEPQPRDTIALTPRLFPAGTRVVVQIPVCPNCGVPADFSHDHESGETGNCQCGFDWREWALNEFS